MPIPYCEECGGAHWASECELRSAEHEPPAAKKQALPASEDPVIAAKDLRAKALGIRRYVCHLCRREFANGHALKNHLRTKEDAMHADHRARMQVNRRISKKASIEHRAVMGQVGGERRFGIGARVVFIGTGDVVKVVGRLEAPDNSWKLEGGRICKFKTEGQTWLWVKSSPSCMVQHHLE
jgi:hypothetical protein